MLLMNDDETMTQNKEHLQGDAHRRVVRRIEEGNKTGDKSGTADKSLEEKGEGYRVRKRNAMAMRLVERVRVMHK